MMATASITSPRRADEVGWDLLRDEWDLLLAIGSGPTGLKALVSRVGGSAASLLSRINRLTAHGLLFEGPEGWGLVSVVYERQEAMSSYLRELVLDRVAKGGAEPVEMAACAGTGAASGLRDVHREADESVLRQVVEIASMPEPDDAERFIVVFAAMTLPVGAEGKTPARVMSTLRGAALQRSRGEDEGLARMWLAEMCVSPSAAVWIGEILASFVSRRDPASFGGSLVTALWAVGSPDRHEVDN